MKKFKKAVIKVVKVKAPENCKETIKKIKAASNRKEVAYILLDANHPDVYATCFAPLEINSFWRQWCTDDYQKYTEEFKKKGKDAIHALANHANTDKQLTMEEAKKAVSDFDKYIDEVSATIETMLSERHEEHQRMQEIIQEVIQERVNQLNEEEKRIREEIAKLKNKVN